MISKKHDQYRDEIAEVLNNLDGVRVRTEQKLNDDAKIAYWREGHQWQGRVDVLVVEPFILPIEVIVMETYSKELEKINVMLEHKPELERIIFFEPTIWLMKNHWKNGYTRKVFYEWNGYHPKNYHEVQQDVLRKWRDEKLIPDIVDINWWNEETLDRIRQTKIFPKFSKHG